MSKWAPSLREVSSVQSDQTWGVFLGAQDCLDVAWPCPSLRNAAVGPDSSVWQRAGPSAWRQDGKDDEVLKSPRGRRVRSRGCQLWARGCQLWAPSPASASSATDGEMAGGVGWTGHRSQGSYPSPSRPAWEMGGSPVLFMSLLRGEANSLVRKSGELMSHVMCVDSVRILT